jgi:hypothetical protein
MLRVSIGSRRKCFPRIGSVLIMMISVRKGGCPSKITGCFVAGSKSLQDQLVSRTKKKKVLKIEMKRNGLYYV